MIRFLQKDNRVVKAIFIVIIAVAAITMVITLVPGIFDDSTTSDAYATVHSGGIFGRYLGSSSEILTPEVQEVAQRMAEEQHLPDQVLPFLLPRAGQALVQREVLVQEGNRLGLQVSDDDLRHALQTGPFGQQLFPGGQFIGSDKYDDFVQNNFHTSTQNFENQLKKELEINRLEATVTGGVMVSDQQVRDSYRQQGAKVKFDYAVIDSADLAKEINPTDAELQAFFKQNADHYKTAIPETRKIEYIAFGQNQLPGSTPQVTDQQIAAYYQQHLKDYDVPDEVTVRHILVQVAPDATPEVDAAAKAKAQDILKQLQGGADFDTLAKKYSDDPGSKDKGGELGPLRRGATVPAFESAAFALQPGQLSNVVKTQFGYHIIKVEAKQTAHVKTLEEVKPQILATLTRDAEAQQQAAFAQTLAAEAAKTGLAATAAAHHLQVTTSGYVAQNAVLPGLADSSKLLTSAFAAKQGAAPEVATAGDGYAVFQVSGIMAARAPVFEEFKSQLLDDFREQQLPQLLARKTNELADKAHAEGNLAQAAKELGATIKTSDLVGRDSQVEDIGQLGTAGPELFTLSVGQISKAINTGQAGVVAKITEKQEPSAAEIAKNFDATHERLVSSQRDDIFDVFVNDLTTRYQKRGLIRINKNAQSSLQQGLPS
jgi:peptidyl-prolyl cis-trans isomerase D